MSDLDPFSEVLFLFKNQMNPPYTLYKCVRNPVITTAREIKNAVVAKKHDGIFGFLYSYNNLIYEQWEDNRQLTAKLFEKPSDLNNKDYVVNALGDGFVYGAERIGNCKVVLLYVAQVRGLPVYNVHDILLLYFKTPFTDRVSQRYVAQFYHSENVIDPKGIEGIIFHTSDDKIYKQKNKNTVDLLYENGFFKTNKGLIECFENNLENGVVYECDLNCKVIKARRDRFSSNTLAQMKRIFKTMPTLLAN